MTNHYTGPDVADVQALTEILTMLDTFGSPEDRARYLLTCNWFTREGVAVATRAAISSATFWASRNNVSAGQTA